MSTTGPGESLVEHYRQLLADSHRRAEVTAPTSLWYEGRPLTTSVEAFELFARMGAAAHIAAIVRTFVAAAGVDDHEDFALSCLPSATLPSTTCRATALSIGFVEVIVVNVDRSTGLVDRVDVWAEEDEKLGWLRRVTGAWLRSSDLEGPCKRIGIPGDKALAVLADERCRAVVHRRVAGLRARRGRARVDRWHNPWLWSMVRESTVPPRSSDPDPDEVTGADDWDVTADDVMRMGARRTAQQAFRDHLLEQGPIECAICGIDLEEVLEAAHIVPHSQGGRASSDNGRLLCANHHRAFDRRLYEWYRDRFVWIGEGPEPVLGGRRRRSRG